MKRALAAGLVLAALCAASAPAETASRRAKVRWVIDGDTFQTDAGERVRLIGLNAPEYAPKHGKNEPLGYEAFAFARDTLAGRTVSLEQDAEGEDRYGRTLAYVFLEDGTFFNELLVARGLAKARYYKPNGRYRERLNRAQKAAKRKLWACGPP